MESSLQHKVDMVSRLEHKTTQMAATIRDMEEGSVSRLSYTIRYDMIDDLHWKTDRQAASLI